jgi:hypothetical protein
LNGCGNTSVSNPEPEPYYPSCEAVKNAAKADTPDAVWQDMKNMAVVMEQIRTTLPDDEQPQFGECRL